jgi:hypothetical protein
LCGCENEKRQPRLRLPFVFCYPKDGAALDNMCSAESAGEGKTRKGQPGTLIAKTPRALLEFTTKTLFKSARVLIE